MVYLPHALGQRTFAPSEAQAESRRGKSGQQNMRGLPEKGVTPAFGGVKGGNIDSNDE